MHQLEMMTTESALDDDKMHQPRVMTNCISLMASMSTVWISMPVMSALHSIEYAETVPTSPCPPRMRQVMQYQVKQVE